MHVMIPMGIITSTSGGLRLSTPGKLKLLSVNENNVVDRGELGFAGQNLTEDALEVAAADLLHLRGAQAGAEEQIRNL